MEPVQDKPAPYPICPLTSAACWATELVPNCVDQCQWAKDTRKPSMARVSPLYISTRPPRTLDGRPAPRVQYDESTMEFVSPSGYDPHDPANALKPSPSQPSFEVRVSKLTEEMEALRRSLTLQMYLAGLGVLLAAVNFLIWLTLS